MCLYRTVQPIPARRYGLRNLYACKHVQGAKSRESEPPARGVEIHRVVAAYFNHQVSARRSTDLEVFESLMNGASIEVREVLEKFRENRIFDPDKILAAELHIAVDQGFNPVEDSEDEQQTPEYEGTLDPSLLDSAFLRN
jgi:hypothetical protein